MENNQPKYVMIVEKSSSSLGIRKDNGKYILEGTFAEFDIENNNKRIYREKEYTPHLEYLNKKIKSGSLLGELDHPEKFDISLSKVSHVIEHLEYVPEKRQVVGRIRILNTDAGRNAKALIDDGIQLSISSRAAGVVKENKEVEIKRIFTYDLVAEPGFQNAQLTRINENLGFDPNDEYLGIFEYEGKLPFLSDDNEDEINNENKSEKINSNMENFVTVENLNKYSAHIIEKFKELEAIITNKLSENSDLYEELETLKNNHTKLKEYAEYLAKTTNDSIKYTEYVAETADNLINHNNHLVENVNNIIKYQEYLAEHLDDNITESKNTIKYTNYLGNMLDESIQFTEHTATNVKNLSEHNDYIVENLNNSINHTDYLVNETNKVIQYADYLNEHVNNSLNYSNYLGEKLNSAINYSNYLSETMQTGSFNVSNSDTILKETTNLENKVTSILETVKKQKLSDVNEKSKFAYYQLLGEAKQKEFLVLPDNQKTKVMTAVQEIKPINESQFIEIWNSVLDDKKIEEKYFTDLFAEMPDEMRPIWENLNESEKNRILIQASEWHNLKTSYDRKMFWLSKKQLTQAIEIQKLNEGLNIEDEQKLADRQGYNNSYMRQIGSQLDRFNRGW